MNTRYVEVNSYEEMEKEVIKAVNNGYRYTNTWGNRRHFWKHDRHLVIECKFWIEDYCKEI